jgi:radical SAM protein with 4Fe4S-binding SPASM domain
MSKRARLYFEAAALAKGGHILKDTLEMCCEDGFDTFSVETTLGEAKGNALARKVLDTEKSLRKRYRYRASNTIVCHREQLRTLNPKSLAKKKFWLKVNCADWQEYTMLLEHLDKSGAAAQFDMAGSFQANCTDLFDEWLYAKEVAEIANFTALLKLALMKERSACEHDSCLGTVLSIDGAGTAYWCKHNRPETVLCHSGEAKIFPDYLSKGSFERYLDAHYQKRERCRTECQCYELCQGGCPLHCDPQGDQPSLCTERDFAERIDHVSRKMRGIMEAGELALINKHARAILLDAVAHAPFSEVFV